MKDRPRAFLVKDTGKLERDRMVGVVMKVGKEGEGVVSVEWKGKKNIRLSFYRSGF